MPPKPGYDVVYMQYSDVTIVGVSLINIMILLKDRVVLICQVFHL